MVYTVARALEVIRHAGYGTTGLPARDYVNEAGWRLLSMRTWAWAQSPPTQLPVRAPLTFTGAAWAAATRQLTVAGGWTGYTHAPGDTLTITDAGTGADLRDVTIEEKLNDNGVRLKESISSSNQTGIGGTTNANRAIILPSDYGGQLRATAATAGRTISLDLVSQADLLRLRALQTIPVVGSYVGSIFSAEDLTTGGGPLQQRLEIWPYPEEADPNIFTATYSVAWRPRELDTDILSLPPWIEPLFTEVLRAVTAGYEDEESGGVVARINEVKGGSTFYDAARHDSLVQEGYGYVGGGAEQYGHWPNGGWWGGQPPVADLP